MEFITQSFETLLNVPAETYIFVLGAAGVSVVTQVAKKLLSVENEKYVILLFTALAFLASGLEYLLFSAHLPPTILGVSTALIMGVAQPIYFWVVKPASLFVKDVRNYRAQLLAKTEEIEAKASAQNKILNADGNLSREGTSTAQATEGLAKLNEALKPPQPPASHTVDF